MFIIGLFEEFVCQNVKEIYENVEQATITIPLPSTILIGYASVTRIARMDCYYQLNPNTNEIEKKALKKSRKVNKMCRKKGRHMSQASRNKQTCRIDP